MRHCQRIDEARKDETIANISITTTCYTILCLSFEIINESNYLWGVFFLLGRCNIHIDMFVQLVRDCFGGTCAVSVVPRASVCEYHASCITLNSRIWHSLFSCAIMTVSNKNCCMPLLVLGRRALRNVCNRSIQIRLKNVQLFQSYAICSACLFIIPRHSFILHFVD